MKTKLIFKPYESVGLVKFGEERADVRAALGEHREYKKNKFSSNTLDDFGSCQVFYNSNNTVEAIEMYRNVELLYNGVNLFSLNKDQMLDTINDSEVKIDDFGITFPSIGISISLENNLPDSILAYKKGYM